MFIIFEFFVYPLWMYILKKYVGNFYLSKIFHFVPFQEM